VGSKNYTPNALVDLACPHRCSSPSLDTGTEFSVTFNAAGVVTSSGAKSAGLAVRDEDFGTTCRDVRTRSWYQWG